MKMIKEVNLTKSECSECKRAMGVISSKDVSESDKEKLVFISIEVKQCEKCGELRVFKKIDS